MTTSPANLESLIRSGANMAEVLRNSQVGAYIYPVVPSEFSNWRDEQKAWREAAVLFDQSHHMAELVVEGPDATKLLSYLTINTFSNFPVDRAKQMVPCSYSGHVIGDGILFHLAENLYDFVGRVPSVNWIEFHAATGGYDVEVRRDDRSASRPMGKAVSRNHYRYQIQGPNAAKVIEKLNGGPIPEIRFFFMDSIPIAGRRVRCLRHGMAGEPGLEIWGPYAERDEVRDAILEAGAEFGLVPVGSRTYAVNAVESGWIPSPLPAVYTDERMASYRQSLPLDSYEATGSIAGSFVSDNIEDYYLTPYELGYGPFVKFDHDFIGRDALEKIANKPHRQKVTLVWNSDDVSQVLSSMFEPMPYKYIDLPLSNYASSSYDKVTRNGRTVGLSTTSGFSYNERQMLSLGMVDPDVEIGDDLVLVWGEPDGGTRKTTVERHRQTEIRVKVMPAPYSRDARESYASGWRTRQLSPAL